jgi:hypothetical protein
METVFSRLRRLEASKDRSLHEMIVDACDAGDELVEALADARFWIGMQDRQSAELGLKIDRALARAHVSNGNTPDNGKAVA